MIVQFRELAAILEEFSSQMEQASDVTASWEEMLSGILRQEAICAWTTCWCFNMKISRRRFSHSQRQRAMYDGGDVAELWDARSPEVTGVWRTAAPDHPQCGDLPFLWKKVNTGWCTAWRAAPGGEPISGDTCTVQTGLPGQVIMSLSDGMGSGRSASEDSEKVMS